MAIKIWKSDVVKEIGEQGIGEAEQGIYYFESELLWGGSDNVGEVSQKRGVRKRPFY